MESDEAANSTDLLDDLPMVYIHSSSSSVSSNKNGTQPNEITTKRKNGGDINTNTTKTNKREEKRAKQDAEKEKLAQEKAQRKEAHELNKIYEPRECMKYMKIEIHPDLLRDIGDVGREVGLLGVKIVPTTNLCSHGLIQWKRCLPQKLLSADGQLGLSASEELCESGLLFMTIDEAFQLVVGHTLTNHVQFISEAANIKVTLVVFGAQAYFKSNGRKSKENRNARITEMDLEMAITDLLVCTGSDTVLVNNWEELLTLIAQSTKAIAEAPHRRRKRDFDDQVDFYMRGDNKKCIAVDKDGNGLSNLWQQMISVLPSCSLETSRALCSNYKTPTALYETLSLEGGVQKIADLEVSRSAVPGSRSRRIGPEFAKKLHTLFTTTDYTQTL